jgi:hypothetical protein
MFFEAIVRYSTILCLSSDTLCNIPSTHHCSLLIVAILHIRPGFG